MPGKLVTWVASTVMMLFVYINIIVAMFTKIIVLNMLWPILYKICLIAGTFSLILAGFPGGLKAIKSFLLLMIEITLWPLVYNVFMTSVSGEITSAFSEFAIITGTRTTMSEIVAANVAVLTKVLGMMSAGQSITNFSMGAAGGRASGISGSIGSALSNAGSSMLKTDLSGGGNSKYSANTVSEFSSKDISNKSSDSAQKNNNAGIDIGTKVSGNESNNQKNTK